MNHARMQKLQLILLLLRVPADFIALLLAALTAYIIRYESLYKTVRPILSQVQFPVYANIVVQVAALWVVIFAIAGLYVSRRIAIRTELLRVILGCSLGVVALIGLMFWQQELFSSRFIVLVAWALGIVYVSIGRLIIRMIEAVLFRLNVGTLKTVVIGSGTAAEALTADFTRRPSLGAKIVRAFPTFNATTEKALVSMKEKGLVDQILLADPRASKEEALDVLDFAEANHLQFKYSADLFETTVKNFEIGTYAGIPVIEFKPTRLEGWGRIYKRAFDIVASLLLLVIALPIMIIVAIAIKIDSRGPILFAKDDEGNPVTRIGEGGRPFRYFKFRSMIPGQHWMRYTKLAKQDTRKDGPLVKIKNDPRITRVGRFIRKFSIDEFPEFFLVLGGKMSLIGPRPHLPEEVAKYEPRHRKVHNIKPGITGLAQISGRADLSFEEEVRLDMYYMENWSPWLDLYILFKTPFIILSKKGAS